MSPTHRVRLTVFADYHQFYIWDPILSDSQAPEEWSDQDVANRAKVADGVVVVCPLRNMCVPVEISFWKAEPAVSLAEWQHVVLCPLRVDGGTVRIHECTGAALAEFSVAPGDCAVRCLFNGLTTISDHGLEGSGFYSIQIWPRHLSGMQLIKLWEGT